MATALVLGATGLVGRALTGLLLQNGHWQQVQVFVRRSTGIVHPQLQEHIVDFDQPQSWQHLVRGNVLFSALGTTLTKAGGKAPQYKVDYHYQYNFAAAAAANGVEKYVLVSAANSSLNSVFFYSRMKAELERDAAKLPFNQIAIMRPGMLSGPRTEDRIGERIALSIAHILQHVPGLSALKPITDIEVAKCMLLAAQKQAEKLRIYSMKELFAMAAQYDAAAVA